MTVIRSKHIGHIFPSVNGFRIARAFVESIEDQLAAAARFQNLFSALVVSIVHATVARQQTAKKNSLSLTVRSNSIREA